MHAIVYSRLYNQNKKTQALSCSAKREVNPNKSLIEGRALTKYKHSHSREDQTQQALSLLSGA